MGPESHKEQSNRRRWRWLFLALPLAVLAAILLIPNLRSPVTTALPVPASTPTPTPVPTPQPIQGTITDAYTGAAVRGVTVSTDRGEEIATSPAGDFSIPGGTSPLTITVAAPSYATEVVAIDGKEAVSIALRPTSLEGQVTNAYTGEVMPGVTLTVTGQTTFGQVSDYITETATLTSTILITTTTGEDGRYRVDEVPPEASLAVSVADYRPILQPVGRSTRLDLALRPNVLHLYVRNPDGEPIPGAMVAYDDELARTDQDGKLDLADAPETLELAVKAGGYRPERLTSRAAVSQTIVLEPFVARGIYLTGPTAGDPQRFNYLLSLVNRTELNSMVIDVKDATGYVLYDSAIPMVNEVGAERVFISDLRATLATLRENEVYAIARIVIFEDPVLSDARPDLAALSISTGQPWKDFNGLGWTNPFLPQVWDYNIEIAKEVAALGFDEVQFDYVRFPSDGNLRDLGYGDQVETEQTRRQAIRDFLGTAQKELAPLGVVLSADIFGLTMWAQDDMGIGQKLEDVVAEVDYISPMVYPSHFYPGNLGFSNPAEHPYEVVFQSCEEGAKKMEGTYALNRPWLQDFTLGTVYTPAMVKAQIQAAEDFGTSGWLLWNAGNEYTEEILRPGE